MTKDRLPLVGVLGGMGPAATADFYAKLVAATPADTDQQHLPVIVHGVPQIPDRSAAFLSAGPSPEPVLVRYARWLEAGGADLIVMPCNTAHLWHRAVANAVQVPLLHIADAVLDEIEPLTDADQPLAVGLLATTATVQSKLYPSRTAPRLAATRWLAPDDEEQTTLVMPGIAAVKAGQLDAGRALLRRAAQALAARGARVFVYGCTEVPLVLGRDEAGVLGIDSTAALARATVRAAMSLATSTTTV